MSHLFWLNDAAWGAIEPFMPKNQPGARRVDDRRVISGIFHVLKTGGRWCDCPQDYGPYKTIYNRFNRWTYAGHWDRIMEAVADAHNVDTVMVDGTSVRAHHSATTLKKTTRVVAWGARAAV